LSVSIRLFSLIGFLISALPIVKKIKLKMFLACFVRIYFLCTALKEINDPKKEHF
jgi:hypothetical protein